MNRIYDEKTNINENKTKEFWNNRAKNYDKESPWISVIFGDKNRASIWDEYEKSKVLPLLNINANDTVIDVGCGIGRLCDAIIPNCKFYLGTDYAEDLIELAKKRIAYPNKNYSFLTAAMQDISCKNSALPAGYKYSVAIISSVLFYINDNDVKTGLSNLLTVMSDSCRIYIHVTVGISQRLTLNGFYSDELNSEYNAIYRTQEEYIELFSVLKENGFNLVKRGELMAQTHNDSETQRIYFIYER